MLAKVLNMRNLISYGELLFHTLFLGQWSTGGSGAGLAAPWLANGFGGVCSP